MIEMPEGDAHTALKLWYFLRDVNNRRPKFNPFPGYTFKPMFNLPFAKFEEYAD